jgi:hypothetical protein
VVTCPFSTGVHLPPYHVRLSASSDFSYLEIILPDLGRSLLKVPEDTYAPNWQYLCIAFHFINCLALTDSTVKI